MIMMMMITIIINLNRSDFDIRHVASVFIHICIIMTNHKYHSAIYLIIFSFQDVILIHFTIVASNIS